jgi:TetR/AcrR family transcriptional repressor of nem operon
MVESLFRLFASQRNRPLGFDTRRPVNYSKRPVGRVSSAREKIIEAATDLIWMHSVGTVGVDAICERADVRKGSFYHFFRSKDELVATALQQNWEARQPQLEAIFAADVAPLQRFVQYFAHVYTRQMSLRAKYGRVVGCFYASVGTECLQDSPLIAVKTKEILADYVRILEASIRDAQQAGAVPRGNARALAKLLFAYMEGVLGQARIHDDLDMIKQLRRTGPALLLAQTEKRAAGSHL